MIPTMTTPEEMESHEQIQSKFETDRAFSEEPVAQSLGRFAWLSTRLQAEFTLTLFDLGIEENKIPAVVEALGETLEDYCDFVRIGLGATRNTESDSHPVEEALYETVDELMETIDISGDVDILDSHLFEGGDKQMMDYGEMSEEDLIHRLNVHINRLESKSSE
jgi:hypothetical protein